MLVLFGTRIYWLANPTRQTIEIFTLDDDIEAYTLLKLFRVGELATSKLLPEFVIPVKAVFDAGVNMVALKGCLIRG